MSDAPREGSDDGGCSEGSAAEGPVWASTEVILQLRQRRAGGDSGEGEDDDGNQSPDEVVGVLTFGVESNRSEYLDLLDGTDDSTGEKLWDSSTVLAEWLLARYVVPGLSGGDQDLGADGWADAVQPRLLGPVLELGAGATGVCGLALARWADRVLITDGEEVMLEHIGKGYAEGANESEIVKAPLRFGTETTEAFLADHGGGSTFDLIVASEVIYPEPFVTPGCVPEYFETLTVALTRSPDACAVLAYVERLPGTTKLLKDKAAEFGFTFERERVSKTWIYTFRWADEGTSSDAA